MLLKCQQGDLAKRRHAILQFDRATVCSAVLVLAHFGCVTASCGTAVPSAEKAGFSIARSYIVGVWCATESMLHLHNQTAATGMCQGLL